MWANGKPCRIVLLGNEAKAARWLGWAKRRLMALRGRGPLRKSYQCGDGTLVMIKANLGPIDDIFIQSSGFVFLNGLLRLVLPPKPIFDELDPTWDLRNKDAKPYQVLKDFYPRTAKQGAETFGPWGDSQRLALNWTRDGPGHPNSVLWKTPGKFTGLMRSVVQLLLGLAVPIPYDYRFYTCHGIWVSKTGVPWVVEISRANGVRAWKLPTLKRYKSSNGLSKIEAEIADKLGFFPQHAEIGKQREQAVVLATAAAIADFYAKEPFFDTCGWAFDYTGHKAQNTCWAFEGADGGYMRSYRYELTISESDDKPVQALLSQVETGIVHGNRVSGFKVPMEVGPVSMIDFDLYYGKNPAYLGSNGPLYVFYDRSNAEVVARMTPGQGSYHDYQWLGFAKDRGLASGQAAGQDLGGGYFNIDATRSRNAAPAVTGGHIPGDSWSGNWETIIITTTDTTYAGVSDDYWRQEGRNTVFNTIRIGSYSWDSYQNGSHGEDCSILAPWYDREAVYSARRQLDSASTRNWGQCGDTSFFGGTVVACIGWSGIPREFYWDAGFAQDPHIGGHSSIWLAFSGLILPRLPTQGASVHANECESLYKADPLTQSSASNVNVSRIDVRLLTSSGTADLASFATANEYELLASEFNLFFERWTTEGSDHFMAVYRDAFADATQNQYYAYTAPNLHSPLFWQAPNYPSDLAGRVLPITFVGKP